MSAPRVLVAGIGNVFLGDDGFGVAVAGQLCGRTWDEGVTIRDFGIRGFDLALALSSGYDAAVLVDATARGEAPGTLFLLEVDPAAPCGAAPPDGHSLDPVAVLSLARQLGRLPQRVLVLGCEPADFGPPDEGRLGLSAAVTAAIPGAVDMLVAVVAELCQARSPAEEAA